MSVRRLIERRPRVGRRVLVVLGIAVALVLLAYPVALASDVISNVAPASQLPSGSLTNAYPLGNYTLDHHFDAVSAGVFSGVDVSGIPPTIAWFLAEFIWELTAFLANAVITLFTFAFSLDLVNGSAATGGAGALAPVSDAVRSIYRDTFGEPWLVLAILLTGLWAMWHALVRRRYTETAGALGVSVLFVVIALAFVTRPEVIGEASKWTNRMSTTFLALSAHGSLGNEEQAKQANADQLFERLAYEPWVVLNFGGLEHCVTGTGDDQRSVPVRPLSRDPGRDAALSRRLAAGTQVQADGKVCINNANKYAARFLRYPPDSSLRDGEYDALKDGDTGKLTPFGAGGLDRGYQLGDADKPAADAMGKGGQYQRLLLAVVILLGELGIFLLLGAVAVAVILAQVLVLLLLAFAPVALVLGVFPGRGHEFFVSWLSRLASYLLRKAAYSLLLAVLLTVSAALAAATTNLGWLFAFGLQAVFHWTVLLNRRQLVGQFTHTLTGHGRVESDGLGRATLATYAAVRLATRHLRRRRDDSDQRGGGHTHGARPPRDLPPADSGPESSGPAPTGTPPDDGASDAAAPVPPPAGSGTGNGHRVPAPPLDATSSRTPKDTPATPSGQRVAPAAATAADAAEQGASRPAGALGDGDAPAATDAAAPDGAASAPAASRPEEGARDPAQDSPLRRGLHDDARRLRRVAHRVDEEGQQLAEEGRRLRADARRAHGRSVDPGEPPASRTRSPHERVEAPHPAPAPPPPVSSDGEA